MGRRDLVALGLILMGQQLVLVFWSSPRIEIGENILQVRPNPTAMEAAWPRPVQEKWRELFTLIYPYGQGVTDNSWQKYPEPTEPFSFHPQSFWSQPKYSRRQQNFHFQGLYDLQGGFVNDSRYGFYQGSMHRRAMPFWVMLEWGPHTAGGSLFWKGEVIQVGAGGEARIVFHPEFSGQKLGPADLGTQWYFAFFPEAWKKIPGTPAGFSPKTDSIYAAIRQNSAYPHLEFRPALWASLGGWIQQGLALAFFALLVTRVTPLRAREAWVPVGLALAGYLIIKLMMHYDWGKNLLNLYPPHGGGDDGISHESLGLGIVRNLKEGHLAAALAGGEPVFYSTPGLRYFRALEKIFFGATNLGYTLGLTLLPVTLWGLLRNWLSPRTALGICALFLLLPPNLNFSFSSYVTLGRLGYPEPLATLVFLGALWILFLPHSRPGAGKRALWFLSGFLLFLGIFLRPNHAIPAGVAALAAIGMTWNQRDRASLAWFLAGLGFFVLLPMHNIVLGGKFLWITSSVSIALPIPWSTYPRAVGELMQGVPGEACRFVGERLYRIATLPTLVFPSWLSPFTWIGLVARFLALGVTLWTVAQGPRSAGPRLFWLALIALANFPFLLIVFDPNPRYIALGWDLCFCTALVFVLLRMRIRFHGEYGSS